jgi:hypothetical protein
VALALAGCDQYEPEPESGRGPALHAIAISPGQNAGLECLLDAGGADGGIDPECGVAPNAVIQIRFDRFLLPASVTRQAIRLYQRRDADDVLLGSPFLEPDYDVFERVVTYRPSGLEPSTLYTFEFVVPRDANTDGFRAFDGAPIEEREVPLRIQFRTAERTPRPPSELPEATCREAVDAFSVGGCSAPGCHNPATDPKCPPGQAIPSGEGCVGVPRMGLELDSAAGLQKTAIGRIAHQTEIGPRGGGLPNASPLRLGVQMPIIDPGRPGNSYLLYKLVRKDRNFRRTVGDPNDVCTSELGVLLPPGVCLPPPDEEKVRLREWFVRGDPMPLTETDQLTLQRLKRLQEWIAKGAICP